MIDPRGICCLAVLTVLVLAAPAPLAQGVPAFERTTHDFGQIVAASQVATTFTFVNRGDRPLRIAAVRPSCGCTVPRYTDSEVPPGSVGEVEVVFDATGRAGRVRQSVVVIAEVGADDLVTRDLVITADVVPASVAGGVVQGGVRFDSDVADLGRVRAGETVTHRFTMQRVGRRPLAIRAAFSFPEGAEIAYPELPVYEGDMVAVEVTLPGDLVAGPFDVAVALETDDGDEPIKALRVRGVAD